MPSKKSIVLGKGYNGETYETKSFKDTIRTRPDLYIGSNIKLSDSKYWIYNKISDIIEKVKCSYVPGCIKLFDEIVTNAADNVKRCYDSDYPTTTININLDKESGIIKVSNDGMGFPIYQVEDCDNRYLPEILICEENSGSNLDDSAQERTWGGRNGIGIKAVNYLSSFFSIRTYDYDKGLYYSQKMIDGEPSSPKIKKTSKPHNTTIVYKPLYKEIFNMDSLDETTIKIIHRRCWDIAASLAGYGVTINYCGELIQIKSHKRYVKKIFPNMAKENYIRKKGKRGKCYYDIFILSSSKKINFSIINGIFVSSGTHFREIDKQIKRYIRGKYGNDIQTGDITSKYAIVLFMDILNPGFDGQTKEKLTTPPKDYGIKIELDDATLSEMDEFDSFQKMISQFDRNKLKSELKKHKINPTIWAKYSPAPHAGKKGKKCYLIITEGDSAKAPILNARGNNPIYGIFPLRGKPKNVTGLNPVKLFDDTYVTLIKIMNLDFGKSYRTQKERDTLNYSGGIIIACDQDLDGSHIKGLIVNFFAIYWPALLKNDNFIYQFITPLIKANGKWFFTESRYKEYIKDLRKRPNTKYYKGLGTST
ncbi:MAG: toprim domain-containing protein, partial [bacterium]